jgi:hypothetical protein
MSCNKQKEINDNLSIIESNNANTFNTQCAESICYIDGMLHFYNDSVYAAMINLGSADLIKEIILQKVPSFHSYNDDLLS